MLWVFQTCLFFHFLREICNKLNFSLGKGLRQTLISLYWKTELASSVVNRLYIFSEHLPCQVCGNLHHFFVGPIQGEFFGNVIDVSKQLKDFLNNKLALIFSSDPGSIWLAISTHLKAASLGIDKITPNDFAEDLGYQLGITRKYQIHLANLKLRQWLFFAGRIIGTLRLWSIPSW